MRLIGPKLLVPSVSAGGAVEDQGPIVCVCHNVGARRISAAIAGGATSLDQVGAACGAGTNCGSCRPEIAALISAQRDTGKLAAE